MKTAAPIKNDIEALAVALRLAITALTETQRDKAMIFVRDYAANMTRAQIETAKRAALKQL